MLLASKTEKIYLDKNPFVKYFIMTLTILVFEDETELTIKCIPVNWSISGWRFK